MPYVKGESLRNRLTRQKQLPMAGAVRIATEVASALDCAPPQRFQSTRPGASTYRASVPTSLLPNARY